MRITKLIGHVTSSLWFVPVMCVLAGVAISFGAIALDRSFDYEAIPQSLVGGPDAAAEILSIIAVSMVSLTALVLTITMVVVQLAMGQFSPRIVQRILQDKPSQLAIGLFVATFVHAILASREVTNLGDGTGQVPGHRGRDGLRARPREHRGPRPLRAPHRAVAPRLLADRARRQGHAQADRAQVSGPDVRPGAGARRSQDRVRQEVRRHHRDRIRRSRRGGRASGLPPGARSGTRRVRAGGGGALPGAWRVGGPGRGTPAQVVDPESGADPRRGRRLRRSPPGRHRRALARGFAVPGPHHRRPGARPAPRHPAAARAAAVSRTAGIATRRGRSGSPSGR